MPERPSLSTLVATRTRLEQAIGGRYTLALAAVVIALLSYPLARGSGWVHLCIDCWVFVTLGFLILSLRRGNFSRVEVMLLGSATVGMAMTNLAAKHWGFDPGLVFLCLLPLSVLFIFYCAWLIVKSLFDVALVTTDMLCGAVLA